MDDEITVGPVLKKPEIKRDPEGRFERHGKGLSKTQKRAKSGNKAMVKSAFMTALADNIKTANIPNTNEPTGGLPKRGPGRPKGVQNKVTVALKEAILQAAHEAHADGMVGYLKVLAIENSSAFAGLLGKVLPSTLAMPEIDDGKPAMVSFQRVIVWPDGHREIEGKTPKQLTNQSLRSDPARDQRDDIDHQPAVGGIGDSEVDKS